MARGVDRRRPGVGPPEHARSGGNRVGRNSENRILLLRWVSDEPNAQATDRRPQGIGIGHELNAREQSTRRFVEGRSPANFSCPSIRWRSPHLRAIATSGSRPCHQPSPIEAVRPLGARFMAPWPNRWDVIAGADPVSRRPRRGGIWGGGRPAERSTGRTTFSP